jgi:hypothetical protein
MSATARPRLRPDLKELLDASGAPWRLDHGTKHWKLIVNERLAVIIPMKRNPREAYHSHKNTLAQVRRALREEALR